MRPSAFLLTCAAVIAFMGCDRDSVSERERNERSNALFAEAMAVEAKGDSAGAEALYRQLLSKDASMASAHLNLAILQHDLKKDYIEAIHHYQTYLDLQPTSEKAGMVRDRMTSARGLLAAQLAADIVAREQRILTTERDSLREQITALERSAAELRKDIASKDATIADLQSQITQLRGLVDTMKSAEVSSNADHEAELAAARKAAEDAKAQSSPSDVDVLIDRVRADAKRMVEEPDGGQAAENAATRKAAEGVVDEKNLSASPVPGRRYTVRPGDTFSKLSREAYGNASGWSRIRDANRSSANPDGRLRAGETILIP